MCGKLEGLAFWEDYQTNVLIQREKHIMDFFKDFLNQVYAG